MSSEPVITKELIAADKQRRVNEFAEQLTELCQKFDCDIIAVVQIVDGRIVAQNVVQPR